VDIGFYAAGANTEDPGNLLGCEFFDGKKNKTGLHLAGKHRDGLGQAVPDLMGGMNGQMLGVDIFKIGFVLFSEDVVTGVQ
jgi:hypothetical protein